MKTLLFSRGGALAALTGLLVFLSNTSAQACAACWGDISGSKMSNAASVGIFAMVIIMFAMLGAIAAFGCYLNYRAKHPLPDYDELTKEDQGPPDPGASP